MEGIDYNVILQDYLDETSQVRSEFIKTFSKVKENSHEIEKLRSRIEMRDQTLRRFYENNGFSQGPNPQELQTLGKVDKEVKNAINKCQDSKMKLLHLKLMLENRIKKMESESLIWDPTAKLADENEEQMTFIDPDSFKTLAAGEKRKASQASINFGGAIVPKARPTSAVRIKKAPRGSHQREKAISRLALNSEYGKPEEYDDEEESENDDRLYCFCNRESFGDMVGCDGEACPYEWFHYGCVGLKEPPKGSWHCPTCSFKLGLV